MLIQPNFDEVQDEVTPGPYKVRVKKSEVKEWPNGGQYINWQLETFGETDPKNNGRSIFYKTSTSGKGAFMLQRFYRAATGEALKGHFDTEQLMGREVVVEVIEGINRQTQEPTGYNEIKTVKPISVAT